MNQIHRTLDPACELYPVPLHPVAFNTSKRVFDVLVAALALVVFAPLLVVVAAAILVETGGPVLFKQSRTGLGGQVFTIFKFCSMRPHACDGVLRQAAKDDDRVTSVGRLIRTLSIDELPQLINVLRGEMSLIGPRPHAVSHDASWARAIPSYALRFRARPGLTGLAQVLGLRGEVQSISEIEDRVRADNAYIDTWSLWNDILIVARTVPLMFRDGHAY